MTAVVAGLSPAPRTVRPLSAGETYARFDGPAGTWTVGNREIEAELEPTAGGSFRIVALLDKATGRRWRASAKQPSALFALVVDGISIDAGSASNLVEERFEEIEAGGVRQVIVLAPAGLLGEIRLELEVYAGQPFLRY